MSDEAKKRLLDDINQGRVLTIQVTWTDRLSRTKDLATEFLDRFLDNDKTNTNSENPK
jgi:DNA invertase Pin-like site-specific DNA recombinase